jgi:hypothetical protein
MVAAWLYPLPWPGDYHTPVLPAQLPEVKALFRGQVYENETIHAGIGAIAHQPLFAVRYHGIVVAHEHYGGLESVRPRLLHILQAVRIRVHAVVKGNLHTSTP